MVCTLQCELLGQLAGDVHAVLQPGQLRAGDPVGVAAQAGRDARLPGLALWVDPDHRRNWRMRGRIEAEVEREK